MGVVGKVVRKCEQRLHNIENIYAVLLFSWIYARKSFSKTTARTPPILQYWISNDSVAFVSR